MTQDIWQLASETSDAEAGFLPNGGGMNDQPVAWVRSYRQFRREKSEWRKSLEPKATDG